MVMTANSQRQLWSMHQIAALLASLGPQALVSTILAPTTAARLTSLVGLAHAGPEFVRICPDWAHKAASDRRIKDFVPIGRQQLCNLTEELVAGTEGVDRYIVNQPLSVLFAASPEPMQHRRVLPLIEALEAYRLSSAVVLGSGSAGVSLLRASRNRSQQLPHIVIFDLSPATWFLPDLQPSTELVHSLLPSHVVIEPAVAAAESGRFLVLSRHGGLGLAINPPEPQEAAEWLASGQVYAAEGRWIAASNRVIWTGHAPGVTLLAERPGQSDRIILSLLSSAQSGINYFVNGRRVRADQADYRAGQTCTVTIAIEPCIARDELIELIIAPVRLSTTARPERLEITGLSFTGR